YWIACAWIGDTVRPVTLVRPERIRLAHRLGQQIARGRDTARAHRLRAGIAVAVGARALPLSARHRAIRRLHRLEAFRVDTARAAPGARLLRARRILHPVIAERIGTLRLRERIDTRATIKTAAPDRERTWI